MREGRSLSHGTVVTADYQEAGRGRLERVWVAPPDSSLLASVLIKPTIAAEVVPQFTPAVALACVRALDERGLATQIRWPNDIISDGRKLAGILCEAAFDGGEFDFAVLSIGINLNQTREEMERIDRPATSCAVETGTRWDRDDLFELVLAHLDQLYRTVHDNGFKAIRAAWEERSALTGLSVTLDLGTRTVEGTVLGIDDDGALRLDCGDGVRSFAVGEVVRVGGKAIC